MPVYFSLTLSKFKVSKLALFMLYCVSNCFKSQYLIFCLHWVNACTFAAVSNIKSTNDRVREGEGNSRDMIHEYLT